MKQRPSPLSWLHLPFGGVARNMILVGGGTALGQGALVVASPILTRLFDPEAFGLLSVYGAVLAVLVSVASLRYDFAIPIANDAAEAVHLFMISVVLAVVASALLGIVVVGWGPDLAVFLGATAFRAFLWVLPVGLMVLAIGQALASWAVFHRSFPALGRWRSVQGLAQAICQVVLGLLRFGPLGLILGDLVGRLFGMQRLLRSLAVDVRGTQISAATLRGYAKARWGFARVMTTASLLNALTTQIPFLLIPAAFGLQSSGQYFLAYRMLVLPSSLVSSAFNQVFFGEASFRRSDPQELHDLAYNGAVSLLIFAVPSYLIVAVGGGALIEFAFGHEWQEAGAYAQIIAPSLILWSVTHPISSLLLIGRRERESLAFTAAELCIRTGALLLGVVAQSLVVGVASLSIVSILLGVGSLWRFLRVASVHLTELIRPTARITALTLPSIVLVILVGLVVPAAVPLAMAVGWCFAFGLAVKVSPELRGLLKDAND